MPPGGRLLHPHREANKPTIQQPPSDGVTLATLSGGLLPPFPFLSFFLVEQRE